MERDIDSGYDKRPEIQRGKDANSKTSPMDKLREKITKDLFNNLTRKKVNHLHSSSY